MHPLPRDRWPDSTLALGMDPYRYISRRCRELHADAFATRLLLRPTICMTGAAAAELFYDPDRFVRQRAMPHRMLVTLLGRRGVQTLDDDEHRHRKQLFMSLMSPARVARMAELSAQAWHQAAMEWQNLQRITFYEQSRRLLTRVACRWADVPLHENEVDRRTAQLSAMFDGAGSIGPRFWRARLARAAGDRWAAGLIAQARATPSAADPDSPLAILAHHRDPRGQLLTPRVAGVELLNLLRPTVAVAVYFTFIAHALHEHPELRARLASQANGFTDHFVQEVRRFYPFFPAVVARARESFDWQGYRFPAGTRVLLDLYGTNHDERLWDSPQRFKPDRFARRQRTAFDFIPQGGGDHATGHRCPGEAVTLELMKTATRFLTRDLEYQIPPQDLTIDFTRLPALPRSHVVMEQVKLLGVPVDAD